MLSRCRCVGFISLLLLLIALGVPAIWIWGANIFPHLFLPSAIDSDVGPPQTEFGPGCIYARIGEVLLARITQGNQTNYAAIRIDNLAMGHRLEASYTCFYGEASAWFPPLNLIDKRKGMLFRRYWWTRNIRSPSPPFRQVLIDSSCTIAMGPAQAGEAFRNDTLYLDWMWPTVLHPLSGPRAVFAATGRSDVREIDVRDPSLAWQTLSNLQEDER